MKPTLFPISTSQSAGIFTGLNYTKLFSTPNNIILIDTDFKNEITDMAAWLFSEFVCIEHLNNIYDIMFTSCVYRTAF